MKVPRISILVKHILLNNSGLEYKAIQLQTYIHHYIVMLQFFCIQFSVSNSQDFLVGDSAPDFNPYGGQEQIDQVD